MKDRLRLHEDVLRKTFLRFDHDGSGSISAEDLRHLLGTDFEGESVEDLLREADETGDGLIDYDEFLHYLHRPEPAAQPAEAGADPEAAAADDEQHTVQLGSRKHGHLEMISQTLDKLLVSHAAAAAAGNDGEGRAASAAPTARGNRQPTLRLKAGAPEERKHISLKEAP